MKTRRNMVKRWIAGVLAVTMLSSTMSTAAFAAPESTDAPETVETTRVTAWNWTDGSALTWQEDTSAWTLTLSEEQTISAEADLLALLPVSVEATLAQAEAEATPAPDTAATPAPESTPDTEATEVTPTPVAEVDPAAEEGATAPAAAALAQPEEGATGADTLSVEPQNDEEATPAPETATPAPTAAPQPTESPAPTADAEPTEEPAAEADTETLTLTWDTAALTYPLAGGDYTVTAALPEGYALDEAAPALAVVVKVPGAEEEDTPAADNSLSDSASAPSMLAENPLETIDTVSPVGTTINLFDYWVGEQRDEKTYSFINYHDKSWGSPVPSYENTSWCTGINKNHVLKFTPYSSEWAFKGVGGAESELLGGQKNPIAKANLYVSENGSKPYSGIVQDHLGSDGFPVLNDKVTTGSVRDDYKGTEELSWGESLSYLFDPGADTQYRKAFSNVKNLLKFDQSSGYYTYDSGTNYAEFYPDNAGSGSFTVYDQADVGFFPFNEFGSVNDEYIPDGGKPDDPKIDANHFFGMTMSTNFMQTANGKSDSGADIEYYFRGDDDVWVFIDGVLVGDLGGLHQTASLRINFNSGEIKVNEQHAGTLKEKFNYAQEDTSNFNGETFADGTYHTLQFFYLERGANASNLTLEFNLVSAPESTIRSVNQNGQGVNGTKFTLYASDEHYSNKDNIDSTTVSLASGVTASEGQLVLKDEHGKNVSLQELWNNVNQQDIYTYQNGERANLILKQELPSGYRGQELNQLYLYRIDDKVLLLSDDTWNTGTYAYSNSTISMDGQVTYGNNNQLANLKDGGTLFAVVLRREKKKTPETDNWYMLTGNATDGWQIGENPVNGNVNQVLSQYSEHPENFYPVSLSSNGGYEVTVRDLPGDITKYYYFLKDSGNENEAEYNIAFYYTSAGSIEQAVQDANQERTTTWMVNNTNSWTRIFSTDIYVANIKNRLLVQQLTPEGKTLTDAEFTLYDKTYDPTLDDGAKEQAKVATLTTTNLTKSGQGIDLDGAALYPTGNAILEDGIYYLVQTKSPTGYKENTTVTKIIVDSTGVYADAGGADDDVQVACGIGSVVKSLAEFASSPDIDATLNNIVAKFYTTPSLPGGNNFVDYDWAKEGTYHPSYWYADGKYSVAGIGEKPTNVTELGMHMEYGTSAAILEYGPGQEILTQLGKDALYWMVTDTGWSNLMIEQCQQHTQTTGKNYEPLAGKDLSNLFSRSVVVQVTDQVQTCDLTISKRVNDPAGNDNNQTFSITVNLTDKNGTPLTSEYSYVGGKLQDTEFGNVVEASSGTLENGSGTVNLKSGQTVTIKNIPYWSNFTVTETGAENYSKTYQVNTSEISPLEENGTSGTIQGHTTVAITNTRIVLGSVAVSNTVDGAMGSYSDTFTYTLKLYDKTADNGNLTIDGTYDATLRTAGQADQQVKIAFTDGQATKMTPVAAEGAETPQAQDIKLAHNDTLTISGLPAGATLEATETENSMGYTVSVDPSKQSASNVGTAIVPNSADVDPVTIAFTNKREAIIPTGLREENHPYIVMIGLAGMAALVGAAGWVEMRRRKRREEE